jgi:hypothetical protein
MLTRCVTLLLCAFATVNLPPDALAVDDDQWVRYTGQGGPGQGKHIVLISGDEEYRSEEALPQLGRILAVRHGFDCTVLFSLNPDDGTIDPQNQTNIPGMHHLAEADLMIIATRFRELPDHDMKYFDDYVHSGKPIIGLRTATHAFQYSRNSQSPYAQYHFASSRWPGGFGQQVLGETWVTHHGEHKRQSTRGVINPQYRDHPILRGVADIWGPTDVYGIEHLPKDADVLVFGQVLTGMEPTDPPVAGAKNDPMMPLFWTRPYTGRNGKSSRIVCTTMGASVDLECDDLRRAVVNACYWALGMEEKIPRESNVDIVGDFSPTFYGFGNHRRGVKPGDLRLP